MNRSDATITPDQRQTVPFLILVVEDDTIRKFANVGDLEVVSDRHKVCFLCRAICKEDPPS